MPGPREIRNIPEGTRLIKFLTATLTLSVGLGAQKLQELQTARSLEENKQKLVREQQERDAQKNIKADANCKICKKHEEEEKKRRQEQEEQNKKESSKTNTTEKTGYTR